MRRWLPNPFILFQGLFRYNLLICVLGAVGLLLTGCLTGCPLSILLSDERLMVPMADGVKLDTRVLHPKDKGSWPVLLYRTPYDELDSDEFQKLALQGYAVVVQNTRGAYDSEGRDFVFAADGWGGEGTAGHTDGLDTVNWILGQSWSNDAIGTFGASARGITQNLLAGAQPQGLQAQWIELAASNLYDGGVFHGGVFRQSDVLAWMLQNGDIQTAREIMEAHPSYDAFWDSFNILTRQEMRDYPVVNVAGWYDTFLQGNIDNYTSIREHGGPIAREHAKLIIQLCSHTTNNGDIEWPKKGSELPKGYGLGPFLNHYLHGEENGFDALPRVAYFMMGDFVNPKAPGNEWRFADDWPIPATETAFYMHNDGSLRLDPAPPASAPITYVYDPRNPVPTLGGANLVLPNGSFDQTKLEQRDDVLTFTFGPFDRPVEVAGPLLVILHASSSRTDTDFTAKLTDVYPDGRSVILCDGIRKARYRNGVDHEEMMTPGVVYEIPVSLASTAMAFDRGHAIRVAISSSNSPRYAPNPNTGAPMSSYDPKKPVEAANTIYMDELRPSRIILPIVGPDANSNGTPDILEP